MSVTIGIVGLGTRGLSILERIIASRFKGKICIKIFEPQDLGAGCHSIDQPEHLLVNTIAEQMTIFPDRSLLQNDRRIVGLSFYEWLKKNKTALGIRENIDPNGYYSRRLFGQYLGWAYSYIIQFTNSNLDIENISNEVVDIIKKDSKWYLITDNDTHYTVDYIVLTTGHNFLGRDQKNFHTEPLHHSEIKNPYPIEVKLKNIKEGQNVIIKGMGLTMFDVLSELTIGRGGYFKRKGFEELKYYPSELEPNIFIYSRSGIPLYSRAKNQKLVSQQYKPSFLTMDVVKSLRHTKKIDFETDILPLLVCDMELAYYEAYLDNSMQGLDKHEFITKLVLLNEIEKKSLIESSIPERDRFSWDKLINPLYQISGMNHQQYEKWLIKHLEIDLEHCNKGNKECAIKAACDVLRDLRDVLREAVDFKGLSEPSQNWLSNHFIPLMNRLAVGAPKQRLEELLALINSGLVNITFGDCPLLTKTESGYLLESSRWPEYSVTARTLIHAQVPLSNLPTSPLWQNMLNKGYVRLFKHGKYESGGIEISRSMNVVNRIGEIEATIWALGVPTEGSKFYTFIVPRPEVNSTALVDANKVVNELILSIDKKSKELGHDIKQYS